MMCGIYQVVVGLGFFDGDFEELASLCSLLGLLK